MVFICEQVKLILVFAIKWSSSVFQYCFLYSVMCYSLILTFSLLHLRSGAKVCRGGCGIAIVGVYRDKSRYLAFAATYRDNVLFPR